MLYHSHTAHTAIILCPTHMYTSFPEQQSTVCQRMFNGSA
jgi:hypothetical protein